MNLLPLIQYMNRIIDLNSDEIEILENFVRYKSYTKGDYIVRQGEVCKYESFVIKGCLKTFYLDPEGQEHIIMFAIEDWWTADLGSYLNQSPADYNIICLEDTEVIQFSAEKMEDLYLTIPKMERFFRVIIQRAYVASEKRLIRNFSLPARDRYLIFRDRYPHIEQRVPQYMIASYLGITKEFLSKIRSQLSSDQ